ncbi:hypothetical protein DdX_17124 [Ditylenchus destructor]|uniref:Uncharacterized protein n=1 Tax=Ditylenchus destructor TaxID=166010 RepID=A0AAD4QZF7_9BILA|nr:hypothetical protein DdX_17124 [Ditylenchus destructor]
MDKLAGQHITSLYGYRIDITQVVGMRKSIDQHRYSLVTESDDIPLDINYHFNENSVELKSIDRKLRAIGDVYGEIFHNETTFCPDNKLQTIYKMSHQATTPNDYKNTRQMLHLVRKKVALLEPILLAKIEKLEAYRSKDIDKEALEEFKTFKHWQEWWEHYDNE